MKKASEIDEKNGIMLKGTKLMKCSFNDYMKLYSADGKNYKGAYLIPEKAYSLLNVIVLAPAHPYIEKFQGRLKVQLEVVKM